MATTIIIVCPQCEKQVKGPADLEGKRVRCRTCGHTFTVQASRPPQPSAEAAPTKAKAKARPAGPPPKEVEDQPYKVIDLDLTPRCPHCAAEMPSPDAFICLSCGYNSQTRERHETRRALETTGRERFVWLLPGILCAVAVLPLLGAIGYLWFGIPREPEETDGWLWARVWGSVICGFGSWFLGRFAVWRLIQNSRPPEKVLR